MSASPNSVPDPLRDPARDFPRLTEGDLPANLPPAPSVNPDALDIPHANGHLPAAAKPTPFIDLAVSEVPVLPFARPPVLLFTRENGRYERYCRSISEGLRERGFEVAVVTFPSGTSSEIIRRAVEEQSAKYSRHVVFADQTVLQEMSRTTYPGLITANSLNSIFTSSSLQLLCEKLKIEGTLYEIGIDPSDRPAYLKMHRERFEAVFRAAILRDKNCPEYVILDSRQIREDPPFYVFDTDHDAVDTLKQWLVNAGYPEKSVVVTDNLAEVNPRIFVNSKNVWLIGDHHWEFKPEAAEEIRKLQSVVSFLRLDRVLEDSTLLEVKSPVVETNPVLDPTMLPPVQVDFQDPAQRERMLRRVLEKQVKNPSPAGNGSTISEVDKPFSLTTLTLGLNFLVEDMVHERVLPAELFRQGPQLVRDVCEVIEQRVAANAHLVILP